MAGRAKLDVLEERIETLRARAAGDEVAAWVATLSSETIDEMERRLVAGETPEALAKEIMGRGKD